MTISKKRTLPRAEQRRLNAYRQRRSNWKHWGPYLAERAWGTVREDYSADGKAWEYFPHEHARSRAYRWNEDSLAGFCDRYQMLCFGIALWNGQDPFLKERLFGLGGPEGNHGEDVKELYWYLDSTPTHSYAQMRYRYPQSAYPYADLLEQNKARGYTETEYEISDTGVFADARFFDVTVTYAKASENDMLVSITIHNHANAAADLTLVPQLWFRNTWSWGYPEGPQGNMPSMPAMSLLDEHTLLAEHPVLGRYHLQWQGKPEAMFTNNDTNRELLFDSASRTPWVKDAFHRYIINGETAAINPAHEGTKAGLRYQMHVAAGSSTTVQLRLSEKHQTKPFVGFKPTIDKRRTEADAFYDSIQAAGLNDDDRQIQRQALAGMLWSKQLYYYDIRQWHQGDPVLPVHRDLPRNEHWQHLNNFDVLSMPDKWEYPWFAVWDTAFHCLPLAMVDVEFAKRQLLIMTREWYMHPNGQLPAYEWAFDDVNPPVHAWSALQVYRMEEKQYGKGDRGFLESIFQKMLLNFTWWVNRKDANGNFIFEGGFLGLDNISVFDRSAEPPTGGWLSQSDGTAWMGFFSSRMLRIALELAEENPTYQDIATKFFEHYLRIAQAIHGNGRHAGLWDDEDGFFYDQLHLHDDHSSPLKVRSLVGLMPLIAVSIIEHDVYDKAPEFSRRMEWLLQRQPELADAMADLHEHGNNECHLLSFVTAEKLRRILRYLLDENEFLSAHGIRSLSKVHLDEPYLFTTDSGEVLSVRYEPAESSSNMFGGNSNWRGPVWFPINYLLIESLRQYHRFYGDAFTVECPTGSANQMHLNEVADELSRRLVTLFQPGKDGARPWCGSDDVLAEASDAGMHLFYEYFNGDTGAGLGASHQTGWTGLVAILMQRAGAE
jgi:hypothetical protein